MCIRDRSWTVLSQAAPILVAAPRYIAGTITLGVLMQISQAFLQMTCLLYTSPSPRDS